MNGTDTHFNEKNDVIKKILESNTIKIEDFIYFVETTTQSRDQNTMRYFSRQPKSDLLSYAVHIGVQQLSDSYEDILKSVLLPTHTSYEEFYLFIKIKSISSGGITTNVPAINKLKEYLKNKNLSKSNKIY